MLSISQFLSQTLVLTLLLPTALANPLQKRAFTLTQVPGRSYIKNGALEILKTYRKYGVTPPAYLEKAAQARAAQIQAIADSGGYDEERAKVNGTALFYSADEWGAWYLTPTKIGNSYVDMNIDTGSADLWAYSTLNPSILGNHTYYEVSHDRQLQNHTFDATYMDGTGAQGLVYLDQVSLGPLTVPDQAIGAAYWVSPSFQEDQLTDGMLGLAFNQHSTVKPTKQKTFFDNIRPHLTEPLFAVELKTGAPGSYDFGFIDEAKYVGDIAWTDVNNTDGYWAFTATGYSVNNSAGTDWRVEIIADTGTTLSYLPGVLVEMYYASAPLGWAEWSTEYGGWLIHCHFPNYLPGFKLFLGDDRTELEFSGYYIPWGPPVDAEREMCLGGIQNGDDLGVYIFGDTLLNRKYVIHEYREDKPRIGFGIQPPDPFPSSPSRVRGCQKVSHDHM